MKQLLSFLFTGFKVFDVLTLIQTGDVKNSQLK